MHSMFKPILCSQSEIELFSLHQSMHHVLILFMHHIDCYFLYYLCSNLQFALGFSFLFFFFVSYVSILSNLRIMSRKTRANRKSSSSFVPTFGSDRFPSEKNQKTYEKLNLLRFVWAERKVVLDEFDPKIRRSFEHRGWLTLMDIDHPPPTTLIREFYSNLFVHTYDSNTQVKSWI